MTERVAFKRLCKNNAINIYDNDDKEEIDVINKAFTELKKLRKVMRIIKKKQPDMYLLSSCKDMKLDSKTAANYYNQDINVYEFQITEAEYKYLEEYL